MRSSTVLALAVLLVLAGCGAGGSTSTATPTATATSTPTPTTTATPTAAPTATATATPTASPTVTATATPTATPTPTPTPTPTATPESKAVIVNVGEWAITESQGTQIEYKVKGWRTTEELDSVGAAPEDEKWVVVVIEIRNLGGEVATLGYTQWSMEGFDGVGHSPDSEAMREETGTLPERTTLDFNTRKEYRVIFSAQYTNDLTFFIEPYGDSDGPTVQVNT